MDLGAQFSAIDPEHVSSVNIQGATEDEHRRIIRSLHGLPLSHVQQVSHVQVHPHDPASPIASTTWGEGGTRIDVQPRMLTKTGPTWGAIRMNHFRAEVMAHELGHVVRPSSRNNEYESGHNEGQADNYAVQLGHYPRYPDFLQSGSYNEDFQRGYWHARRSD